MDTRRETMDFPVFSYPYRVFYADTDAGGVVYYAHYLRMFEQARALYVEEFGLSLADLARQNCHFVCRRVEADYHAPAVLGDALLIQTRIVSCDGLSLVFSYEIVRSNESEPAVLVDGKTRMVCCKEKDGRVIPSRIPKWVLEALAPGPKSQKIV